MRIVSDECPTELEDIAEAYIMGTLTKEQVVAFEEHYSGCNPCATVLQNTAEYVDAMRAAAKKLRSDPPG